MKTITPTEQDLILASKLNIVKNPSYRFRLLLPLRWPLTVIGIFLLGVSIYLEKYTCYELTVSIIKLIGFIFFFFGAFGLLSLFLTKIIPKRIWKKNKILHAPYTLTWDHNTLFMHSDHSDSRTDWSSNCQMVQDENYILAYHLQNCFYIIPKRYFENNEEMQDFLNHLENGIKKNKENTQ